MPQPQSSTPASADKVTIQQIVGSPEFRQVAGEMISKFSPPDADGKSKLDKGKIMASLDPKIVGRLAAGLTDSTMPKLGEPNVTFADYLAEAIKRKYLPIDPTVTPAQLEIELARLNNKNTQLPAFSPEEIKTLGDAARRIVKERQATVDHETAKDAKPAAPGTETTADAKSTDGKDTKTTADAKSTDGKDTKTTADAKSTDGKDTKTTADAKPADGKDAKTPGKPESEEAKLARERFEYEQKRDKERDEKEQQALADKADKDKKDAIKNGNVGKIEEIISTIVAIAGVFGMHLETMGENLKGMMEARAEQDGDPANLKMTAMMDLGKQAFGMVTGGGMEASGLTDARDKQAATTRG